MHRRLAEAPASLMGPRLIVLVNPDIEISLQLVDETIHLFAERDTVKLIEHGFVEALADAVGLRALGLRVCPKSSSSQTKLSEHEANRGEAEKSECVSGEIFKILGQAATAIEPSEGAFDDPPPW